MSGSLRLRRIGSHVVTSGSPSPASGAAAAPLGVAVVGAGRMGTFHAHNLAGMPGATVPIVVDVVEDAAQELAAAVGAEATTDLAAALARADVGAVVITVTSAAHHEAILAAAAAGKHVFVEKPITLTVSQSL